MSGSTDFSLSILTGVFICIKTTNRCSVCSQTYIFFLAPHLLATFIYFLYTWRWSVCLAQIVEMLKFNLLNNIYELRPLIFHLNF